MLDIPHDDGNLWQRQFAPLFCGGFCLVLTLLLDAMQTLWLFAALFDFSLSARLLALGILLDINSCSTHLLQESHT